MSRFAGRSSVVDRMKNLGVVDEEAPVGEFGQINSFSTPPRQRETRLAGQAASKHLSLRKSLGPVPLLAGMILPPSPPDSPGVFDLGAQNPAGSYLFSQPRAETPPYSDEDDESECPLTPSSARALHSSSSSKPPTDFAPAFVRAPAAYTSLPSSSTLPRRTSSPPTLEQITQRLCEAKRDFHSAAAGPRRHSDMPVSPSSKTIGLPTPVRAETLPSRLPKFLLNRARTHPVPSTPADASRTLPSPPSSAPPTTGHKAKPRMVIQEIPTFKLTPPPEREERAIALRERLSRPRAPSTSSTTTVERRRSTGSTLGGSPFLGGDAPGGLRVPGL